MPEPSDIVGRPRAARGLLRIPPREEHPGRSILLRLSIALCLLLFTVCVVLISGDGYRDANGDGSVSLLDAFYYATVSVTTTGYGDIVPVTREARLLAAFLVTPARVLFLILLVGTSIEVLGGRARQLYIENRARRLLKEHFVICGYGVKGKSAVRVLRERGVPRDRIIVIDNTQQAVNQANAAGLLAIQGNASSTAVLDEAGLRAAQALVVAPDTDEAAVLITLTARQMAPPGLTVVAAAREEENAELLRRSGADSVITSAEAAGRLLGLATETPRVVKVLEDLLSTGVGLDIAERPVEPHETGPRSSLRPEHLILGVVRNAELMRFDDPRAQELLLGDRILYLFGPDTDED